MRKILFGCVTDTSNEKYLIQALRLVASLRWFGGKAKNSAFLLCSVGEPNKYYKRKFLEYGAQIKVVKGFDVRHGPSNKLRFIESVELKDIDTIALLDCDTVILQDPTPYFCGSGFSAKPADLATVTPKEFNQLFKNLNIPPPKTRIETSIDQRRIYPYFNAGVCLFSADIFDSFAKQWLENHLWCLDNWDNLPYNKFFTDQVSLALTVIQLGTRFNLLPVALNFPTHLKPEAYPDYFHRVEPIIMHYHNKIDENLLLSNPPLKMAQKFVSMYNAKLNKERLFHDIA